VWQSSIGRNIQSGCMLKDEGSMTNDPNEYRVIFIGMIGVTCGGILVVIRVDPWELSEYPCRNKSDGARIINGQDEFGMILTEYR